MYEKCKIAYFLIISNPNCKNLTQQECLMSGTLGHFCRPTWSSWRNETAGDGRVKRKLYSLVRCILVFSRREETHRDVWDGTCSMPLALDLVVSSGRRTAI